VLGVGRVVRIAYLLVCMVGLQKSRLATVETRKGNENGNRNGYGEMGVKTIIGTIMNKDR
jgi:hypothetical protein